nr:MAG TPA: hypothetical protein [Caudoviricetes sp.]
MKDNSERDIPYVSKDLCVYLRERFSLQNLLYDLEDDDDTPAERILGTFLGVNAIIETLEGIQTMQEEHDGIRG